MLAAFGRAQGCWILSITAGGRLNINMSSYQYRVPMLKIRRSRDRLIFNMGIPIPGKDGICMEIVPRLAKPMVLFTRFFIFTRISQRKYTLALQWYFFFISVQSYNLQWESAVMQVWYRPVIKYVSLQWLNNVLQPLSTVWLLFRGKAIVYVWTIFQNHSWKCYTLN